MGALVALNPPRTPLVKASACRVVAKRVDWLTLGFRVDLSDACLAKLREAGKSALQQDAPCSFMLGRYEGKLSLEYGAPGARAFRMGIPKRDGKWQLQNSLMRVEVLEHGAGAVPEHAEGGAHDVAWTVSVQMSGTALLAMGLRAAVLEAWKVAELLGDVYEGRGGRMDLCCDVAGYDLREDDRASFVRRSQVTYAARFHDGLFFTKTRKGRAVRGEESSTETVAWHRDAGEIVDQEDAGHVQSYVGDSFTGFSFGLSRKAISCRVYDKVLELRSPKKGKTVADSDKRRAEFAEWKRGGWKGLDEEPEVTRVEFETRGEALDELGLRCPTRPETGGAEEHARALLAALDPAWAYFTRSWLRLVRRSDPKGPAQPRWRAVQEVTFLEAAEPRKRERDRSGAKAPQAMGSAFSMLAAAGDMGPAPWLPAVETRPWPSTNDGRPEALRGAALAAWKLAGRPNFTRDGEVVDPWRFGVQPGRLVDELLLGLPEEAAEAKARAELDESLDRVMRRAGARIAKCAVERHGSARGALVNVVQKWGAALARFSEATAAGPEVDDGHAVAV